MKGKVVARSPVISVARFARFATSVDITISCIS